MTSIAGIVSVLLVAAGLFYTNEANRKQQELNRAQQALAERGQAADRFSRVIDQLGQEGDDRVSIRLGAIYALERLMRDAPSDLPAVVEVLNAFVRSHAARLPEPPRPDGWRPPESPADVRAAVVALARRPSPRTFPNADFSGLVLGLPYLHVDGAFLSEVDLRFVDLRGASLANANFRLADLSFADLFASDLFHGSFGGALLHGAAIQAADLSEADLRGAQLSSADLTKARLRGADMTGADLSHAILRDADVHGADLSKASLARADLSATDLSETFGLSSSQLRCTILEGARLPTGVVGRDTDVVLSDPSC
ncbi:pentapeptide repeat-containing protein [Dactylosporangium sp. AC04546]|uniref:pentapeptide repeat-containing protein n=1 Tax=Dactylosporangium sp. AC04546 TaxID=2862460 RepID=UPI001EDF2EE7|nr:pentapeptide repeat-containing protein [Dactylosporangium sp. AC04546]WVK80054.1 pentapeptide repeat-containing protein [Dactylosporangium sp. AC04546]